MTRPLVVLVGPPGAGKSTVGRLVADLLGAGFRDTDTDVETAAGMSVSDLFLGPGEEAFRVLEREAVAAALASHPGVVSLGGGAVLDAGTRALLAEHHVILLTAGLGELAKRVGLSRNRPVLAMNPRATLAALLTERMPLYEQVARHRVDTDGMTPEQAAAGVVATLGSPA